MHLITPTMAVIHWVSKPYSDLYHGFVSRFYINTFCIKLQDILPEHPLSCKPPKTLDLWEQKDSFLAPHCLGWNCPGLGAGEEGETWWGMLLEGSWGKYISLGQWLGAGQNHFHVLFSEIIWNNYCAWSALPHHPACLAGSTSVQLLSKRWRVRGWELVGHCVPFRNRKRQVE